VGAIRLLLVKQTIAKLCLGSVIVACSLAASLPASASEVNHVGAQLDLGVPDGAAFGMVVKPRWYWLGVGLSGTYNGFAPGVRGSVKLDPIKFPIRLTLTGELGHSFEGNASALAKTDLPGFSYTYANLQPGIEIGSNNGFSFFVHAGPTWMNLQTNGFQRTVLKEDSDVVVSDPHGSFTIFPTVKLGFVLLFI